ncbi:MAG: ATP-binding protein [Pontiellaceae bacterium]|jgi:signal transduction histidine kinase|nr:ATP-binding protein [Pontiellaceae bacterium]
MLRSFKLKIGLLSVAFSGVLLLGFSLFFFQMLYRIGIDRTDRELRALVEADIRKTQPRNHWARFEGSLKTLYGDLSDRQFILNVESSVDELLFVSPQWPPEASVLKKPEPVSAVPAVPPEESRPRPFDQPQNKRPPANPPLEISGPEFTTVGIWRIIAIRNPEVTLCLGTSLEPLNAELNRFRNALLLAGPVALFLLSVCGWLLALLALRPVQTISRTVETITARNLGQRITAARADQEFHQLIELINGMLNRLEKSFQQATRFSADAAHELKTPLTILQGELEHALQSAKDNSAEQKTYKELLDEVQRLKSIVRKLLLLSQADSGQMVLSKEPVNLTRMIEAVCEDIQLIAPGLEIRTELQPDVQVMADPDLLNQIIQNLAGNAVKFCRGEAPITISLQTKNERTVFRISNRGEIIPETDREKIFERFYRANRNTEGSGLGLSLAREIARAHGGTLILESSGSDGTVFCLALPSA